jgi:hypothetical protein
VLYLITPGKVQSKHNQFSANYNGGDMFRLTESSSGQSLNHVYGTSSEMHIFGIPKSLHLFGSSWYYCNNFYLIICLSLL